MIPKNEDDIGPSKVLFTTCPSTAPLKTLKIELYLTSSWPWEDGTLKFSAQVLTQLQFLHSSWSPIQI